MQIPSKSSRSRHDATRKGVLILGYLLLPSPKRATDFCPEYFHSLSRYLAAVQDSDTNAGSGVFEQCGTNATCEIRNW